MSLDRTLAARRADWRVLGALLAALLIAPWQVVHAQELVTLDEMSFSQLPGNRVRVDLTLSKPIEDPLSFAIDSPARIALDFPSVKLNLARRTENIGVGMARSVTAVEASGRTRVVLNLIKLVPYELITTGNRVSITLDGAEQSGIAGLSTPVSGAVASAAGAGRGSIENIDFRRGENGEGRVIVTLSDPSVVIDTKEEGDRIVISFFGAQLPERLAQRLDVLDFATPVKSVTTRAQGRNVNMVVAAGGNFETIAYQSDDLFTLDVRPITAREEDEARAKKDQFSGERLSLNFQSIEVRAVLQLIADFTGLNLVASDTVGGELTLRLKNVPWDQALDIILKTKGLAMRQTGNVMLVAPSEEIATRERLELESQKQIEELAPLRSEFIQVNYAKAAILAGLLKAEGNSQMSERGNVSVDDRTNTLLVRDTQAAINNVRALVNRLDIPVRQVLIESRIVIADDTFNRDLGVRFGLSKRAQGKDTFALGGGLPGNTDFGDTVTFNTGGLENFIVDLPIGGPAANLELAIIAIPDFLLQLELQAAQAEGRGEVLSNPRVITSNQKEAVIEQGTEIPFQEATSSGATSTSFKKAVLSLRVTPQITPDDRVIMDLSVSQDTVGQVFGGVPSVNTRNINTQVLVDNGDTVVLGGIFEQTKRSDQEKVPFFGDLPYFGFLFKTTSIRDDKTELLIFVTPKILKEVLTGG